MSESTDESMSEITWGKPIEGWLKEVAEQAQCRSIMYDKAFVLYSRKKSYFEIPIIILSSLVGFASVGSSTMFEGDQKMASVGLGLASLVVSIANTVNSYYGYSKLAESARVAAISYKRMYMLVELQLRLPVLERIRAKDLVKMVKSEIERMVETTHPLPDTIVNNFRGKYKDYISTISFPQESNGLKAVTIHEAPIMRQPSFPATPKPVVQPPESGEA